MVRQHSIRRIFSPPLRALQGLSQSSLLNKKRLSLIFTSCSCSVAVLKCWACSQAQWVFVLRSDGFLMFHFFLMAVRLLTLCRQLRGRIAKVLFKRKRKVGQVFKSHFVA